MKFEDIIDAGLQLMQLGELSELSDDERSQLIRIAKERQAAPPADLASEVYHALPAPMQSKIDEKSWIETFVEQFGAIVNEGIAETINGLENPILDVEVGVDDDVFALRFGEVSFSPEGAIDDHILRSYESDPYSEYSPLRRMVFAGDTEIGERPVLTFRATEDEEDNIDLPIGLTVLIAQSGFGKTSLIRQMMIQALSIEVPTGFIPWNERESYSYTGSPHHLVALIKRQLEQEVRFLTLDSLREFAVGGPAPGKGGVNTSFFMHLTDWHHRFADNSVHGLVIVNPNSVNDELIEGILESLRGSVGGIIHLTARGRANVENTHIGRVQKSITIHQTLHGVKWSRGENMDREHTGAVTVTEQGAAQAAASPESAVFSDFGKFSSSDVNARLKTLTTNLK